jgi:hypothetical protein
MGFVDPVTGLGSIFGGSGRGSLGGNGLEAGVLGQGMLPIIIYLYYYILIAHK